MAKEELSSLTTLAQVVSAITAKSFHCSAVADISSSFLSLKGFRVLGELGDLSAVRKLAGAEVSSELDVFETKVSGLSTHCATAGKVCVVTAVFCNNNSGSLS